MSYNEEKQEIEKLINQNHSYSDMMKINDHLWSYAVKLKAGFKSQLSGSIVSLQAHHIFKKPNLALRYDLMNGLSVTDNEHAMIHSNMTLWEPRIRSIIGRDEWERLKELKWTKPQKVFMETIRLRLVEQIKELERERNANNLR